MKYIKEFEKLDSINQPKVGDYVYIYSDYADNAIIDFLSNNIGQIIKIKDDRFIVKFDNVPDKLNIESKKYDYDKLKYAFSKNTWITDYSEVIEFSPTKEELELRINANKYEL